MSSKRDLLSKIEFSMQYDNPPDTLNKHRITNAFVLGKEMGFDAAIEECWQIAWDHYKACKIGRGGDCPLESIDIREVADKIKSLKEG